MDHQIHLYHAAIITKNADSITVQSGTVQMFIKRIYRKHMEILPMKIVVREVPTL